MTTLTVTAQSPTTRRVRVGRHQVIVDTYGDQGSPVVCLHGIPGWRGTWSQVGPRLARRYRVVAPDLLGFGESDEPIGDFHMRGQAEMILGLLDALDLERAHLVGFDFGGPVAVTAYRLAPERVASLTLANTNLFTDTPIPGPLKIARVPGLGPVAFRMLSGRTGLSMMWRAAVADPAAFPFAKYESYLRWSAGIRWTGRILLASMRDMPRTYRDVEAALPHIRVPTTVIWSDRDPFFAPSVGARTARAIRGSRLVALTGCGHFVPEERADAFVTAMEAMLA